jgi:alpha-tubulin suppressor-like RCC1 family protein
LLTVRLTDAAGNVDSQRVTIRRKPPYHELTGGVGHWCMLDDANSAWCWGINANGELGTGDAVSSQVPVPVTGGLRFRQLAPGYDNTCGLTMNGDVYCWGGSEREFSTYRTTVTTLRPTLVPGGIRFAALSASWDHQCGVSTSGVAYCWGSNNSAELGLGTISASTKAEETTPQRVATSTVFDSISAGELHSCAFTLAGDMWCWGWNLYGQIGTGAQTPLTIATPVRAAAGLRFSSMLTGPNHTCGIAADSYAYCWGRSDARQLGTGGGLGAYPTPSRVLTPEPVTAISITFEHGCAIGASGAAYCWGDNYFDKMGRLFVDAFFGWDVYPARSAYGLTFQSVRTGAYGTCALSADGALYCWGAGDYYGTTNPIGTEPRARAGFR